MTTTMGQQDQQNQQDQHKEKVRKAYGEIALTTNSEAAEACCEPQCCGDVEAAETKAPDYSKAEIASVPRGAFLSQGSGNPVRAADLQPGETVIDLGSGAGMDIFLAANVVGKEGRAIGFDMTPEMLERAKKNLTTGDYPQVEFRSAEIDKLPQPDASVDAALSNCVINLAPDKLAVYQEIHRVLKPGARFAIADIVLRGDAELIYKNADKLPGCSCLSTALREDIYLDTIRDAGFENVEIVAERPAISDDDIKAFAAVLGIDATNPPVTARAVTIVGRKPTAN